MGMMKINSYETKSHFSTPILNSNSNAESYVEKQHSACSHMDKACQTDTPLVTTNSRARENILDDYDYFVKSDFSFLFKKEDKKAYKALLNCQAKLKNIDRAFLKKTIDGDIGHYSEDEIERQYNHIFEEVIGSLSETLQAIEDIEPRPRLLLSVRITNIMATLTVVAITAAMFLLPALFPAFFVAGTISYGTLTFLNREGTLTLNISGIFLSIYQWIANKRDNDALQEFENFRNRLSHVTTYFNEMRSKIMYSQINQLGRQLNSQMAQLNERVSEQMAHQAHHAHHQEQTAEQIKRANNEITELKNQMNQIQQFLSTIPRSLISNIELVESRQDSAHNTSLNTTRDTNNHVFFENEPHSMRKK